MKIFNRKKIFQNLEEIVAPKHTALLVHETMNDFCSPGGIQAGPERPWFMEGMLEKLVNLVDVARKAGVQIVYVRYTNARDYRNITEPQIAKNYMGIIKPEKPLHVVEGTWGWEVIDELKPQAGDWFVNKYRIDAFVGSSLDAMLRSNQIKSFAIAGIGLEVGMVPTISHGFNLGYYCVAPEDCMKARSGEEWRQLSMKFIERWAWVTNSQELINLWGKS